MLVVILGVFLKDAPDVRIITLFQLLFYDTLLKDIFDIELWTNRGQDTAKKKSQWVPNTLLLLNIQPMPGVVV